MFFREIVWMNEFIAKPRKSFGVEGIDKPINHSPYARYADCIGMIGEPYIELEAEAYIDRNDAPADSARVGRQDANTRTLSYGPKIGAAHVCTQHNMPFQ